MHVFIGILSILGYFFNTIFWVIPIVFLSFFKLIPIRPWQTAISYLLDGCATTWISLNTLNQNLVSKTLFDVSGANGLTPKDWYLVISNHRSWVDILVLQRIFNRKIPFLKFFLKKELIWVPFLGLAWWALDFPFMRRHNKAFLAKHPELKGKDLEATRLACEKFRFKPVSIMNFVEGTRFTKQKNLSQNAPYEHLLNPKAGGMAFVLSTMGDKLHKLLDITIHYPQGTPSFWQFVCGKVRHIQVSINVFSIEELVKSDIFAPDYFDNPAQREKFQLWLGTLWQQKDQDLKKLTMSQL
ncbi:acyltransferase [Paraglaciecola sp.]|uniref:acyltransferase n=1 Tax=Paraglaciecola sp. TaxID=1920173 RepID=UPI0030F45967